MLRQTTPPSAAKHPLAGKEHGSQAEAVRKVGDLYNRSRLTPFVKTLFRKWLAWTR